MNTSTEQVTVPYENEEQHSAYLKSQTVPEVPSTEPPNLAVAAFRDTLLHAGFTYAERIYTNPPDPEFNGDVRTQEILKAQQGLPVDMWKALDTASSKTELYSIRDSLQKDIQASKALDDAGVLGSAVHFATNMFDVDTVFAFATAGKAFGATVKAAAPKTFAETVAKATVAGTGIGTGFGVGEYMLDPKGSGADILGGAIYGTMFGAALGTAAGGIAIPAKRLANKSLEELSQEYPKMASDTRFGTDSLDAVTQSEGKVFHLDGDELTAAATEVASKIPTTVSASPIADSLQRALEKTPFKTDYSTVKNSPSPTAKLFAFEVLEDPSGEFVNNRSAAMLNEMYESRLSGKVLTDYDSQFKDFTSGRTGVLGRLFNKELSKEFNEEILKELNRRWHNKPEMPGDIKPHKAVLAAADSVDAATKEAVNIGRGRPGEQSIQGFENMEPRSGYFRLAWSGPKMVNAIRSAGEENVKDLLKSAYKAANPEFSDEVIQTITDAVVTRTKGKALDVDHDFHNFLSQDPRDYSREVLLNYGVPESKVDNLVKELHSSVEERGQAGYTKHRTPVDLEVEHPNGLRMLDLIDTDVPRVWSLYSRDVAGRAALARKGITSMSELTRVIGHIVKEDNMAGGTLTRDYMKDLMTYFKPGPIAGGVSDTVRRVKQVVNLSLLNKLGLAQLAETGVGIAGVGVEAYLKHASIAKDVLFSASKKEAHSLAQDFAWMTGEFWNEHLLHRVDLGLDYTRTAAASNNETLLKLDRLLSTGQHIQGYTSGYFGIKALQTMTTVASHADKVLKVIRDGNLDEFRRLESSGFTPGFIARIKQKYIDTGIVEFSPDGSFTNKMNGREWDYRDFENFSLAMTRHVHAVIQKSLPGESTIWMHKDAGALFTQLSHFPILAAEKQFIRNLRIGDGTAVMMFSYGLATAATAYIIKQSIDLKPDKLDPVSIARGAFNMSNMTGWLPMFTDPLMYMLNADDAMMNAQFGRGGVGIPPAIPVANRLFLGVPRALFPDGEFTKQDAQALKALPLIGNAYGFSALFDSLVTDKPGKVSGVRKDAE